MAPPRVRQWATRMGQWLPTAPRFLKGANPLDNEAPGSERERPGPSGWWARPGRVGHPKGQWLPTSSAS